MRNSLLLVLALGPPLLAESPIKTTGTQSPEVLAHVKEVRAGFEGAPGRVAQFGDSITYSMAFWSPMSWHDPGQYLTAEDGLPKAPKKQAWKDAIKGSRDKGKEFGNYSGWRVGNVLGSVETVLARDRPEFALLMVGTNDTSGKKVPQNYRADLEKIVAACLAAHCVPILNTIPPRRDHEEVVEEINALIREVANREKIPLADYHAACLLLRPGKTWDGTLISKDGVHPSGGKSNLYTEANLRDSGYALRNWINFLVLRQVWLGAR